MKNIILLILLSCSLCSCTLYGPPAGLAYTEHKGPLDATGNDVGYKVGSGQVITWFGLYSKGDASIHSAALQADIKQISHVDYEIYSILGVYTRYTIFVYGK